MSQIICIKYQHLVNIFSRSPQQQTAWQKDDARESRSKMQTCCCYAPTNHIKVKLNYLASSKITHCTICMKKGSRIVFLMVAVCSFVSLQSVCYTQLFIAPQLFIPALTLWLWECPHWNRNWELCSDDLSLIFWTFYDDSRECHIILSLSYKSNCCDKQQK